MDDHNLLSLTSISLLYHFVNVLYNWIIFLLLNTFWQEWPRLVTLCNELPYIISFDLYSLSMTLIDANEHNISVSHFLYICALFLLLYSFIHERSRLVTICNVLLYIINFELYTVSMTLFEYTEHNFSFSHDTYKWTNFTVKHVLHEWSRLVTHCNELLYNIRFVQHTVSKTIFVATEHKITVSHVLYIWTLIL
jgi:hypothetical protein